MGFAYFILNLIGIITNTRFITHKDMVIFVCCNFYFPVYKNEDNFIPFTEYAKIFTLYSASPEMNQVSGNRDILKGIFPVFCHRLATQR